uniref:DnaA N-terminal domain-containing protein n=1 Tax=Paracoccus shandongensis TaxID=2816048 RepID=UPI00234FDC89
MDDLWGQACATLETSVGPNNFNHWIKPLRLTGLDGGIAHFASPTRFISDWVNRHFAKDIMGVLSRHGQPVERLRFDVVPQAAPGRARPAAAAAAKPARPVASAMAPATARVAR